jgi:tetratricopeptide (TPR) repeat protein
MATQMVKGASASLGTPAQIQALQAAANQAVQSGDVPAAIHNFEQLLTFDPNNAEIISNIGKLQYMTGDLDAALGMFAKASGIAPANEGFRANHLAALMLSAEENSKSGNFTAAIDLLRTALTVDPGHPNPRIDLATALELSGTRAELGDFIPNAMASQLGTHLLIACMPKSGSTFLKETLCALTGWPDTPLAYAFLQNETEIYLPNLLRAASSNTVTQQHVRATAPNVQILQGFGIRPVVLVRRIEDIVLSYSDFNDSGAITNTFFGDVWPTLDQAAKYDLIIDHVMPWYASFYASWELAARQKKLDCLFVTYEEMIADKPSAIATIAGYLGLGKTAADCAAAVQAVDSDGAKTRFNKGVAGRGGAALDDNQRARLRKLFTLWGDLDLERIGLAS